MCCPTFAVVFFHNDCNQQQTTCLAQSDDCLVGVYFSVPLSPSIFGVKINNTHLVCDNIMLLFRFMKQNENKTTFSVVRQLSPEPVTYALTQSFSHASYGIGHAPSSHIAAYVPIMGVLVWLARPSHLIARAFRAGKGWSSGSNN